MRLKKLKYGIFALICMCVAPLITRADCDYQRQAELSRLASNVQLTYVYSDSGFQVIMTNLTSDLYAVDYYGQRIDGGEEKVFEYSSGTVSFDIYAVDSSCTTKKLNTKTVTLPTINIYSYYTECKRFPNFKYCQLWGNFSITEEQFMAAIEEYQEELISNLTVAESEETNTLDVVLETLEENWFMFVIFGVAIIFIIIFTLVRKRRK